MKSYLHFHCEERLSHTDHTNDELNKEDAEDKQTTVVQQVRDVVHLPSRFERAREIKTCSIVARGDISSLKLEGTLDSICEASRPQFS